MAVNSPIVVNALGDSPTAACPATCTLSKAIALANSASNPGLDEIQFSVTGTITLNGSLPVIVEDLIITGSVAGATGQPAIIVDGSGANALLRYTGTGSANYKVTNLELTGGLAPLNSRGGAIFFNPTGASTLTLDNVRVTDNGTNGVSTADGGGIAIMSGHQLLFTDGAVSGNTSPSGMNGGGIYNEGFVKLDGVTVSGNTAGNAVAAPDGIGGGIYIAKTGGVSATVDLRNCTFSKNKADLGGAIGGAASLTNGSSMRNCTIAENTAETAGSGGGIDLQGSENSVFPGVNGNPFTSNIVAKNTANGVAKNCAAPFTYSSTTYGGSNLTDETSCSFDLATDVVTADPKLDAIADYGGLAQTYRLLVGSPAIDKGNPTFSFSADERGAPRADGNESGEAVPEPDIGAYEFGGYGVLEFTTSTFSVVENAGNASISVRRYGNTDVSSTVNVATSSAANGGTPAATAGSDYTTTTGSPSWAAGEGGVKSFNVPILDDNSVEGAENVKLTMTLAGANAYADLGAKAPTANLTITDYEEGAIRFKVSGGTGTVVGSNPGVLNITRGEDGSTGQVITLERVAGKGKDGAVSVTFNTGTGSATNGADYTAVSQTVSWADQDGADKTVTVPILEDNQYEDPSPNNAVGDTDNCDSDPETVPLTLSAPTGNARLDSGTSIYTVATLNIADNDPAATGTFTMSAATYSVNEPTTPLAITVHRTGGDDCAVSVRYDTSNVTATGGTSGSGDYTTITNATLTWAHNDSADKTINVQINNDTTREADERFGVALTSPLPATVPNAPGGSTPPALGTPASAVATIVSDEKLQFKFSASSFTGSEGGSAAVTVQLVAGTITDDVLVDLTAANDTANSSDYTFTSPTVLTFSASTPTPTTTGITTNIPIVADGNLEFQEQFKVSIASHDGEAEVVAPSTDVPVIIPGSQEVRFTAAEYHSTTEGGTLTLGVQRLNGSTGTVSVDYSVGGGTATAGADYSVVGGATGTLTWPAGDTSTKIIDINIAADRIVEQPDETIGLTLSNASGALIGTVAGAAGPGIATAFITDDDIDVVFGAAPSAAEAAGPMTVTVKRVGVATGAVSVNYATANGTAVAGTDYTATSGTLNWTSGDTADKTFTVPITDNTKDNADKTFTISLSNPSANADAGPATTATITDDDAVTVSFSAATQSVSEAVVGGQVTVTATRTGTTDFSIDIPFTIGGSSTATNPADHNATAGTITIPANATSGTYTFMVSNDSLDEPDETVVFNMGTPTGGSVTAAAPSQQTVTITDDDAVTVKFSSAAQAVDESVGNVTVTATRTGATTFAVSVPFTVTGTAVRPDDHNAVSGTINIPANASSGSYTFAVVDDGAQEGDETVIFTMGTPTGGTVTSTAPTTHTVTINANDVPPPSGGGGGSWSLMSLWLLVPAWMRRRRAI